jgi:two-component system, NarL family, sensor histidine kinase YdfH
MEALHSLEAHLRDTSPLRRLLLLCIGLIYLWGAFAGGVVSEQVAPGALLPFTLLMLLHCGLYAVGSSAAADSVWRRACYLAVQALLIVLISVVAHRFTVTLLLYLALVAEIASQVLSVRIVVLQGFACVLLFTLNVHLLFSREPVPLVPSHPFPFSMALVYVLPAFVLIVAYALQQTRAHTRTQKLLRELEQAHRRQAEDAVRIEELTRAAERQRMARELHDTLAQGVTGLVLQLEAVKAHLVEGREQRALEIVKQAMGRARSTLADARSAIDDLRASAIPAADLRRGLEEEARRFTAATGIPCTTRFSSHSPMSSACGEAILRSVAEGLLNVARHARPNQVWLDVTEHDGQLAVEVRDDGYGFDPAAVAGQGHYGLLGLGERARSLGGRLVLRTAPGEGTTLRLLLPAQARGEVA